jgi:hypothetical protein
MKNLMLLLLLLGLPQVARLAETRTVTQGDSILYSNVGVYIKIGDTLAQCKRHIHWQQVSERDVADILQRSPFFWSLSFLQPKHTVFWSNGVTNDNGWPRFIVAHFASADKESLVDLFDVSYGGVAPLLHGRFQKYLESVKVGAPIEEVYRNLGQPFCRYEVRASKGVLIFFFNGSDGRQRKMQVDPCTRTVIDFRDGTLD